MNFKWRLLHSCRQGLVQVFVLHQAAQGSVYGVKLRKLLHAWGYDISAGRLYPMLHAFEQGRLLASRVKICQGRARKYYDITDQGRTLLAEVQQELGGIVTEILSEEWNASDKTSPQGPLCSVSQLR